MSINHENKQLIFPEVVACMALFAAYAFETFPVNQMSDLAGHPHHPL